MTSVCCQHFGLSRPLPRRRGKGPLGKPCRTNGGGGERCCRLGRPHRHRGALRGGRGFTEGQRERGTRKLAPPGGWKPLRLLCLTRCCSSDRIQGHLLHGKCRLCTDTQSPCWRCRDYFLLLLETKDKVFRGCFPNISLNPSSPLRAPSTQFKK